MAAELVTLQLAADVIRAINPAPGTNAIHTELLRMADKLDDLIQSLISGIDDLDISAFERAATLMTGITTDFQTATELTVSFCD